MGAYSEVAAAFDKANTYATSARSQVDSFTHALNTSLYTAPTISVTWQSITEPTLDPLPAAPSMPTINFQVPGNTPTDLTIPTFDIVIDDFTDVAPDVVIPVAPTLTYGQVPAIPSISDVTLPSAPVITMPAIPTYLSLGTVTFAGVDLHADWLNKLSNTPTLSLVEPTPYSYQPGADYSSAVLTSLKNVLLSRLQGGTGLAPAVEQAIWDRARSRELKTASANEAEVMRQSEALGFRLPVGVLAAQLREAQQNYYDKLSELSRDVAIKQADLEQENLKQAIAAGMQLEGQLIDYSYKLEQLSFEDAKTTADNAIAIHRAAIDAFKALLDGYVAYSNGYKTVIEGEMAKVEVYKAELQAEMTKANINQSLVEQYKAQIQASMAYVEIYKAQVGAAETLVHLEQAKVGAAGEQVRAYVAQINAETSKVEAYKAGVQAQGAVVELYKTKAQAFSAKVGAQAEKSRAIIGQYSALVQAKAAEWDGYKTKVQAESARIDALGKQSGALLDGYKATTGALVAKAGMYTQLWETKIKDYEASQSIALQAAKINNDAMQMNNSARLDAAKVGAQVYAQLTASAYSMAHASASISASAANSVGYSYSNDTTTAVSPIQVAVG